MFRLRNKDLCKTEKFGVLELGVTELNVTFDVGIHAFIDVLFALE